MALRHRRNGNLMVGRGGSRLLDELEILAFGSEE